MDSTPIILTGPAGCGKSHWIQMYSKKMNKQLFVCPCRKDRTLREGRQKLHIWARRTEPAILWLEGADDLTPEAQAFLRRILETHSTNVLFILECRDAGRLQEPIRSRCTIKRLPQLNWNNIKEYLELYYPDANKDEIKTYLKRNEYSYRKVNQCVYLQQYYPDIWNKTIEQRILQNNDSTHLTHTNLIEYMKKSYHPEQLIHSLLKNESILKDYGTCIKLNGSLWAFLGNALYNDSTTPHKKEE